MVVCLLGQLSEFSKARMASADLILALMPTILVFAGSNTAETSLLAVRRPLLAVMLVAASPAVTPIRAFESPEPSSILERNGKSLPAYARLESKTTQQVVVAAQYILATLAIANVALICYQLGNYAICAISPEKTYFPLLWTFLMVPVRITGTMTLQVHYTSTISGVFTSRSTSVRQLICDEFTPCYAQEPIILVQKPITIPFLASSWFTSIGTICHIIFGTITLGSYLFIGHQDAMMIFARFLISATICRILVAIEVHGLRGVAIDVSDNIGGKIDESVTKQTV